MNRIKYSIGIFMSLIVFANNARASSDNAWGSMEYMYWWAQNSPIGVPLVTENNNPKLFGFINQPGTQIIFGAGSNQNSFNFGGMSAGRLTIGTWLDGAHQYGVEAIGFDAPQAKTIFSASSINGNVPIVNVPFYSTTTGEDVLVAGLPNTVSISDTFQTYGFEINGLHNLQNQSSLPIYFMTGFRYLNINEGFVLNDAIINTAPFPNSVVNVNDNFSTKNNFYAIQFGLGSKYSYSNFMLDVIAKIALGDNYQTLSIHGQTNVNNTNILQPIGLFAEPSNIGKFTKNQFSILPEMQAKVAYKLTENIRPFFTYDCLYINNIIRPGNQIDRNINQSQNILLGGTGVLSGPVSPALRFNNSGMWMQGVSVGINIVF